MTGVSVTGNATVELLPGFLLASFGIGPAFVAATSTALSNVPSDEAGVASGIVNTFHELGGAIGVAVMSTIAAASISSLDPNSTGYSRAFLICTMIAAVAAIITLILTPAGKPDGSVHGHSH
jgi:sugar phosphate permease